MIKNMIKAHFKTFLFFMLCMGVVGCRKRAATESPKTDEQLTLQPGVYMTNDVLFLSII